jgi:hypothetical protein
MNAPAAAKPRFACPIVEQPPERVATGAIAVPPSHPGRDWQSARKLAPPHCTVAAASAEQAMSGCATRCNFDLNVAPSSIETPAMNPLASSEQAQSSVPRVARHLTWIVDVL